MRRGLLWAAGGALALCAGCADPVAYQDIGVPFNAVFVPYLQQGSTTRAEAQSWFGQPTARITLSDDTGAVTGRERSAYLYGKMDPYGTISQFLEVEFDDNNRVAGVYFLESENEPPDQ